MGLYPWINMATICVAIVFFWDGMEETLSPPGEKGYSFDWWLRGPGHLAGFAFIVIAGLAMREGIAEMSDRYVSCTAFGLGYSLSPLISSQPWTLPIRKQAVIGAGILMMVLNLIGLTAL